MPIENNVLFGDLMVVLEMSGFVRVPRREDVDNGDFVARGKSEPKQNTANGWVIPDCPRRAYARRGCTQKGTGVKRARLCARTITHSLRDVKHA